jgi:WD40 repeat protein
MKTLISHYFLLIFFIFSIIKGFSQDEKNIRLKTELGVHTASIWRMATDSKNKFVVTASEDRTLRIWDFKTGILLNVIRSQQEDEVQGKFFAVDISADASTIVAGGKLTPEIESKDLLNLYNRQTGKLMNSIKNIPARVYCVRFSTDGKYIFAGLEGNAGLAIYEANSGTLILHDKNYQGDIYGIDFDNLGNYASTVSFDGFLRIYDFKNLEKWVILKEQIGSRPYSVAFSPNGNQIAVGCLDDKKVGILSFVNGKLSKPRWLLTNDIAKDEDSHLGNVCFSKDGKYLYASGNVRNGRDFQILRKWRLQDFTLSRDIALPTKNTVLHISPTNNNQIIFTTAEPNWGIIREDDSIGFSTSVGIVEFFGQASYLGISEDGSRIKLRLQSESFSESIFSINDLTLNAATNNEQGFFLPQQSKNYLDKWENSSEPLAFKRAVSLEQNEFSYSACTNHTFSNFAIGTNRFLRFYNARGEILWKIPSPEVAWAVNITKDNKKIIVAFGDGTVRWYRLGDGKELMALFIHPDKKSWIVWTPDGYYACSVGGEDLIGWHLNRGNDTEADFFPISKFRDKFYNPSLIKTVLATLREGSANNSVTEIASKTPPVVSIINPQNGSNLKTDISTLTYLIESDQPIINTKILINGRPASVQRGVKDLDKPLSIDIPLPNGDVNISIVVENRFGYSIPAMVSVNNILTQKPKFISNLYVLSMGVSNYQDASLRLNFAAKDASDVGQFLEKQKGKLYENVFVKELTDKNASKKQLIEGLRWLKENTKKDDIAILYLAGHGFNDEKQNFCYLPVEGNPEKLNQTSVSFEDIRSHLAEISGKVIFFIDACHSGNIVGKKLSPADVTKIANILRSPENGIIFLTSSTGSQVSSENTVWKNGAFTKAVLEGFGGEADSRKKGFVTIYNLNSYVSERVSEITNKAQTPTITMPASMTDFSIIQLK